MTETLLLAALFTLPVVGARVGLRFARANRDIDRLLRDDDIMRELERELERDQ